MHYIVSTLLRWILPGPRLTDSYLVPANDTTGLIAHDHAGRESPIEIGREICRETTTRSYILLLPIELYIHHLLASQM